MKKITFVAAAFAFVGFFSNEASAQTTTEPQQTETQQTETQTQTQPTQQADKEVVTQDLLPAPVKATLASDVYKDWTIGEIYKVAPAAGAAEAKVVYEVTMKNAQGQAGSVMLDEAGKDASTGK